MAKANTGAWKIWGANYRILRDSLGFDIIDIQEKTGIDNNTIGKIERGMQKPHASTKRTLADAIGLTVEEIQRGGPNQSRDKEALMRDVEAAYFAGELTADEIIDKLATWRRMRRDRGLE